MVIKKQVRTLPPKPKGSRKPKRAPVSPKPKRAAPVEAPKFPVYIRATEVDFADTERDFVRQKLARKFGNYVNHIERISVRIHDANGPRGGVDQVCRFKIVLKELPSVVFESRAAALRDAIDTALSGAQRAVRRAVERRSTKPLRKSA